MPAFFEASKNGRKQKEKGEKRSFLPPNNSTMNRIYKKFMAVKPINMNYAGVGTFNCNMFLSDSVEELNEEIIKTFCDLDNASTSVVFDEEEDAINHYVFMANYIVKYLTEKFGSLEECYPSIVKYLFSGNKINSQANKTMFWRVFGDIALKNLKQNLDTCQVCEKCQCKIPQWEHDHECKATGVYLFTCSECGKVCNRVSSRQTRCPACQERYRKMKDRLRKKHKGDEY